MQESQLPDGAAWVSGNLATGRSGNQETQYSTWPSRTGIGGGLPPRALSGLFQEPLETSFVQDGDTQAFGVFVLGARIFPGDDVVRLLADRRCHTAAQALDPS